MFKKQVIDNVFFVTLKDDLTKKLAVVPIKINDDHKSFVDLATTKVYPIVLRDSYISKNDSDEITIVWGDSVPFHGRRRDHYYSTRTEKELFLENPEKPIWGTSICSFGVSSKTYHRERYTGIVGYEDMPIGKRGVDFNLIGDINEWHTWRNKIEYVDFSDLAADYDISLNRSESKTVFSTRTKPTNEKLIRETKKIEAKAKKEGAQILAR